jgi:hypothetical protein
MTADLLVAHWNTVDVIRSVVDKLEAGAVFHATPQRWGMPFTRRHVRHRGISAGMGSHS